MKPAALIACLALLSACAEDTSTPDPRYLYRHPPGDGPSVRNGPDRPAGDGRLFNERGRRVEAFMPGDTDPSMPHDRNNAPAVR